MPDNLLSIGMLVLSWTTNYLVHSTLLVATVCVFFKFRRDAGHRLRELLWKTALVGGLATASAQMLLVPPGTFGSMTWMLPIAQTVEMEQTKSTGDDSSSRVAGRERTLRPEAQSAASPENIDVVVLTIPQDLLVESGGVITESVSAGQHAERNEAVRGVNVENQAEWKIAGSSPAIMLIAIAIVAILWGVARSAWQSLVLSRKLALCAPVEAGLAREILDELCRYVPRAPDIQLLAAPDDSEPAALGVTRWTIILPDRALAELHEDELRSLLAHELAHLVRGDATWLWISRFVCSCLAFQPLNHLARREWQRAAEFLCDQWAVYRTRNPLALARCLTEVAGWRLAAQAPAAALAATGRKSGLVDRIESLLDPLMNLETDERRGGLRAALGGAIGLLLVAMLAPRITVVASAHERQTGIERETRVGAHRLPSQDDSGTFGETTVESAELVSSTEQADWIEQQATLSEKSPEPLEIQPGAVPSRKEIAESLAALDRELAAAEIDLAELHPLIEVAGNVPTVQKLAAQLQDQIHRLKRQRQRLQIHVKVLRK
jgi:beta-lactamase regulating signal transducer with metallopeptidase domain